jgi:ribonuclease R
MISGLFSDCATPAPAGVPTGAIVRVRESSTDILALPKSAQAALYEILERHGLDPAPDPAALTEVAERLATPGFDDEVEDRTDLPFVTIDNEDSRDLDQALFIERYDEGYRVWYALADAAYYVRPGSALHARALARGTSYYLPGLSVPMLPRALSEGIVSLNPGVDRRALIFVSTLDKDGVCLGSEIVRARVRSRAKLSYNGVQQMFDLLAARGARLTAYNRLAIQDFSETLTLLQKVGELRRALSRERDVVEYDRRSADVVISKSNPTEFELVVRERNDVERWNEQISLLCNIEGARLLQHYDRLTDELQAVFRVHLPPLHKRLQALEKSLRELVQAHGLDDSWRWLGIGRETLGDYLDRLPREGSTARIRQAIDRFVRYSNRASEFCAEAGPHHALGVDSYARFSSPMREIVGIFTHKELLEALGREAAGHIGSDEKIREQVIISANAAKKLQKTIDKSIQLEVIRRLLDRELDRAADERPWRMGTVVGVKRDRAYVCLDDFALDLKVYSPDFARWFGADPHFSDCVVSAGDNSIRIGDSVELRVSSWDSGRSRYALDLRRS